jgi:protein involved in polysaccharide export with SLBB domain
MKLSSVSNFINNTLIIVPAMVVILCIAGCGPSASSIEQVRKFDRVGAIRHLQNSQEQLKSKYDCVYRVTAGDVLELKMPETMQETSWEFAQGSDRDKPYYCRVSQDGTIALPVVGAITVEGMTTSQVESTIVQAHYPKYVLQPPAVVCHVDEHRDKRSFSVIGLVKNPDVFDYAPNARYTLMDALAMAGGPDIISNPKYATVYRQDAQGEVVTATFKIDHAHLAEASKVLIEPGDIVSVDRSFSSEMNRVLNRVANFGITVGASVAP